MNPPNLSLSNKLLSYLSPHEQEKILSITKLISFELKEIIYKPGEKIEYVYFPITGMISILHILKNENSAEIGIIGNEGFLGGQILLGDNKTPYKIIAQCNGAAFKISVKDFSNVCNEIPSFRNILLLYIQTLMTQISQTAVCNSHHTIDQRLCRWLLISFDRVPGNELIMTQELISIMLGVRREGVTVAAFKLQNQNIIDYTRGRINIIDRQKLEEMCCECYELVNKEYSRLFSSLN